MTTERHDNSGIDTPSSRMHGTAAIVRRDRARARRLGIRSLPGLLLLTCALGGLGVQNAMASEYKKAATQNYLVQPNPEVSLETATAIIRHKTGGRVLSANSASRGAEVGYQVRVLVDERQVQTWFVDHKGRADAE